MRGAVRAAASLLAASPIVVLGGTRAFADSVSYSVAAQAPVAQITQDDPTAQFHPQGEGDYGYSMVTANPGGDSALSSVLWPGAAVGNAGTLAALLGGPSSLSALNDPVRAQAASGTSQTQDSVSVPSGTVMTASVRPTGPGDQHASATSSLVGGGLGSAGSLGSSQSSSVVDFDTSTGQLDAAATSSASGVDVDGLVHIGSVVSSATATSVDGSAPEVAGKTTFSDFTIAGQQVYVDASGVHVGAPGRPASSAEEQAVDSALHSAGMEVFFTDPHTVVVGEVSYYYAASVLFFWAPPGDPNDDSFTFSVGGAAVSMTASPYSAGAGFFAPQSGLNTPGSANSALNSAAGSGAGATTLSLPTPAAASTAGGSQLATPGLAGAGVSPAGAASSGGGAARDYVPAGVRLAGGLGAGWWALLGVAAAGGAALTTRLPRLLERDAAGVCAKERRRRSTPRRTQ